MFAAADKLRGDREPSDYKHVAIDLTSGIGFKDAGDKFDQVLGNIAESRTLAETGDAPFFKLMSGTIRVREEDAKAEAPLKADNARNHPAQLALPKSWWRVSINVH